MMNLGTHIDLAFNFNPSTVLFHDIFCNGQPQAGPVNASREERVKDLAEVFSRDPYAGILEDDLHLLFFMTIAPCLGEKRVETVKVPP